MENINYDGLEIIGYCAYCHDPVFVDDEKEIIGSKYYHAFCWFQMNNHLGDYFE